MSIEKSSFGTLPNGKEVSRYRITNGSGSNVTVMNHGATLMEVNVPDRSGAMANVNLAFGDLESYLDGHPYFGSTVGRFANRIGDAKFTIDGSTYELTKNHGDHILHGGKDNLAFQFWDAEVLSDGGDPGVRFSVESPAGDNGFPGNLRCVCEYRFNDRGELLIRFTATTDAATHVNLTNHSYFNLHGMGGDKVLDHRVTIEADHVLEVDDDLIPHGGLMDVEGTPFDFRTPRTLGERIDSLPATKGYDHCYVVRGEVGRLRDAARVVDPDTGRTMEVETSLPGMQLYTANHLGGGKNAAGHGQHQAFCMETQSFPNTPNVESFPTTLIRPGDRLDESTVYRFGVAD